MKLDQMFDITLMQEMLAQGYVRRQFHPSEPLAILNYTEKATFGRVWNAVTLTCRGLIYNTETLEIVARPFGKFFNYGEHDIDFDPEALVEVTDKLDGSLGITYIEPTTGNAAIATRGSFTSDQALHATRVLHTRYRDWSPAPGFTVLFEIIYPENRIVVDYGHTDDLFLLGGVEIDTGHDVMANWPGPHTQSFGMMKFSDALRLPDRDGKEGVVVEFIATGVRVKIKQEDYVALHKAISGLNERAVWELLKSGKSDDEIKEGLPEEFWEWLDDVIDDLNGKFDMLYDYVQIEHEGIARKVGLARKTYASEAVKSPNKALLFMLLDGRDITNVVWDRIKP